MVPVLIGVILVGSFIPPLVAGSKGYSFAGFWLAGLVAWPLALLVALVIPDKSRGVTIGSTVRMRNEVKLDNGRIPRGHCSQVFDSTVIDGVAVIEVEAPDGSRRWVARKSVSLL